MRLKLSYSLISLWQRGDMNAVVEALFGVWQPPTDAMNFGTQKHKEWEEEVKRTGCMPLSTIRQDTATPTATQAQFRQVAIRYYDQTPNASRSNTITNTRTKRVQALST